MSNKSFLVVKDCKRKTFPLVDISVPTDNNISKCKDLEIEIEKIFHLKTTIVPVIVGALGMTKKETDKHINKMPDCPSPYEIHTKKKKHFAELLISWRVVLI